MNKRLSWMQKVMKEMLLKNLNNNFAPLRTGGIPLTDNTLQPYELLLLVCPDSIMKALLCLGGSLWNTSLP
jgi:hypothetical protein